MDLKSTNRSVVGKVTSIKMQGTIVIQVERMVRHSLYGKYIKRTSKMYAHDSQNKSSVGDTVLIQQCRPISKTKHWILVDIVESAEKTGSE